MFDRKGCQMSVGHQFRPTAEAEREASQDFLVATARQRNPCISGAQPVLHLPPRQVHRRGSLVDPGIGDHAHKAEQALPGKPHAGGFAQLSIQPSAVEPGQTNGLRCFGC